MAQMVPVLFFVTIVLFFVMRLLPGDPILVLAGDEAGSLDQETIELMRDQLGLNDPVFVQYFNWVSDAVQGDLGRSTRNNLPVMEELVRRIPATAQLAALSIAVAAAIGITTGIIAAVKRNSIADFGATLLAMFGVAIPNFWFSIILISIFVVWLGWLPSSGFVPIWEEPVRGIKLMILPVTALGTTLAAAIMRQTRSNLLEVLNQDYVRTARAKGVSELRVITRHALANALLPVITVVGLQLGSLLAGSVIIESMFSIPGLGRLAVQAISSRDYPMLQGVVLLFTLITVLVNLITDLSYAIIDPRIRYS
ncbi:MAG: ABC transporter permease [Dehalococcoidia bacterium]|nr:ABC transporter permease [Dehalococcoidia bacterium]